MQDIENTENIKMEFTKATYEGTFSVKRPLKLNFFTGKSVQYRLEGEGDIYIIISQALKGDIKAIIFFLVMFISIFVIFSVLTILFITFLTQQNYFGLALIAFLFIGSAYSLILAFYNSFKSHYNK